MTTFAENRRARFDFELLEVFSAGIELTGPEVRSVRTGKVSLAGSYISIRGREAYLLGAEVAPYQPNNQKDEYDERRPRKLLLARPEIEKLTAAEGTKGLTIVPLSIYNKGRFLKLDVAIGRGKKLFDKRESIKKRDVERDQKRSL